MPTELSPHSVLSRIPKSLAAILLLTTCTFCYSLFGQFLNWDEPSMLWGNPHVTADSPKGLFSQYVLGTYVPLTTFSFWLEYHIFGWDPFMFRLNNLMLHLLNTILVFRFAQIFKLNNRAAAICTLLFAIHPMRVENVAWIVARKDLLYTFFFLISLCAYTNFVQSKRSVFYIFALISGVLSVLAKPMALSLPLILLLLDWYHQRGQFLRNLVEKIPFFLTIFPIAGVTYLLNQRSIDVSLSEGVLTWIWSLSFYLHKFILPMNCVPLYQRPFPIDIAQLTYLFALGTIVLCGFMLWHFRKNKDVWFAFLFFLLSIFFLLRFDDQVDVTFVADRYMYLPSLGLCLLFGKEIEKVLHNPFTKGLLVGLFGVLMIATFLQTRIWQNNLTLWDHVVRHTKNSAISYLNRGQAFNEVGAFDRAIDDYSTSLTIDPHQATVYVNRGNTYARIGQQALAFADYDRAILTDPKFLGGYLNKAGYLRHLGHIDQALNVYALALVENLNAPEIFFERAVTLANQGQYDLALTDALKAKELGHFGVEKLIKDLQRFSKEK